MKIATTMAWMLFLGALCLACAGQKIEPQVASSATQANYAAEYPGALQSISNDYVNAEGDVRKNTTDFAKYPEQLKDPPWTVVQGVVTRADEAGRSASYVQGRHDFDVARDFFTQDNGEISRKVAGSAQYVVKKKDCDVDVSGAVASSLKEAVDKQQEKRLRAHNDAHVIIDRYRESLGKANAAALEKQADDISATSYLAYIRTIELKAQATRLLDEASQVRKTLDQSITEERTFQAEPGRSAGDKKASNERIAKMEDGKVRIDAAVPQLQALTKEIDQRNDAIKKEYEKAFDALKKAIAGKSSSK
jgi:post-segregation antitoxin (ccd killing protein)